MGCTRRDHIRNAAILKDLELDVDVVETLRLRPLMYFGHCTCMDSSRCPHILLHGHTVGTRTRGRPKKRWIDNVKEDCAVLS